MKPQSNIQWFYFVMTLVAIGAGCTRAGSNTRVVEETPHALTEGEQAAAAPAGASGGGGAIDLTACRACQVRTQVCSCDQECLKCLFAKGAGGACLMGLAYYHEACACLQQNCGQECPTVCNR
ncbi:MAG: hypothetical protein ABJA82_03465 [Myxococcales bacterium]